MEAYFDLSFFSMLNLLHANWENPSDAVQYSNIFSIVAFSLCVALPLLLIPFLCCYRLDWHTERNIARFGSLLAGVKPSSNTCMVLTVPLFFFARRFLFSVSVFLLNNFVWA